MLRRSARKSGQAPPEDSPTLSPPPKRGRGGGRGRGRGRGGKTAADVVSGATEDTIMDEGAHDESLVDESSFEEPVAAEAAASSPILTDDPVAATAEAGQAPIDLPAIPIPDEQRAPPITPPESDQREESFNSESRSNSRNEERARDEGDDRRDEGRRRRQPDRQDVDDDYRGEGRRRRRSRSREEYDDEYDDRRRSGGRERGGGPPFRHYGGGGGGGGGYNNDGGYGGGGGGGYGRPQWGYGRGRGRGGGDGGYRGGGGGGWRGRGNYGGPGGPPPHPGMMGPPGGWDNNGGYDQMGPPMPLMMNMRGPPHPPPPPHYGMHGGGPPGMPPMPPSHPQHPHAMQQHDYPHPHHQQHPQHPHPSHSPMMGPPGMGPPGMGMPPGMVPPPPPLPPGPPPPPAPTAEMENVKTEEEMAAMKEQIARQIAEAREKAAEGREQEEKKQREEKEEETNEDKTKRVKQASAMLRAALFRKSTTAAAAASSNKAAASTVPVTAVAATPAAASTMSASSTPQPVPPPPPPPASSSHLSISSSLGNNVPSKVSPTVRKPETRDVFGKDDEGGLFGDRKTTLSLPTAADRAEMQLYNDVLNAPHPTQGERERDNPSPRKAPTAVPPPPISTPAIVVSKPVDNRRDDHGGRERRSRSRSAGERGDRGHRGDSRSPRERTRSRGSRSPPRRSPRGSSPRREKERDRERGGDRQNRRSRSRSHGRHRSTRSRSKERGGGGGGGRTRHDSGHYRERRGASPVRERASMTGSRRRAYELSPVRSSGSRPTNRSARRSSKSPSKRERSKSRERRRSRTPVSHRPRRGGRDDEREERERRRSGGDGREERRRKESREDSTRSKENGEGSGDDGKENSSPGHDEDEIDRAIEMDVVEAVMEEKREKDDHTTVATTPSIESDKESVFDDTVPSVAAKADGPRPEPFEEISESIFLTQIKDGNDYGGVCFCEDGLCGISCVMRYLTVECGRRCPSGEKCTNRAMQKKGGAKVEVYHTGSDKGFGVKALEPIKKGAFIIEYIGEVVTHKAGEKRKKQYAKEFPTRRHHYLMTVTDSKNRPFIIDATKFGNSSRFLNHSCEPNAFCDKWSVQRRFRMGFFAKRNIEAGEEITFDYRFQNYGRQLIECACGAPSCRRYLSSKDQAKEAEERLKSGHESESPSDDTEDEDDEDEEEEEDEEMEMKDEDRRKLRKQQTINEEAERLLKKEVLTKKGQLELLSAIMIRLTPAHQPLRTRLLRLLTASAEKNNEVYRIFLQKNGRTILEKYLTLGVDEDTSVCQYRELIPLMEGLLELLDGIKRYTETTRETSVMANLVPLLRLISVQSEVPDSLVVFEVLHDIISGIEEETNSEEEEGEWTKRWTNCTSRAAELAETWQIVYGVRTFKIPKKMEKSDEKERDTTAAKSSAVSPAVSMIRPAAFTRTIKTESVKGWQSSEKKEWRERDNSRDWKDSSFGKDRLSSAERSGGGYRKRKWEEDSTQPTERREERREYGGYRREDERRRDEKEEKRTEPHSATNSSDSPRDEEEDAMQISPNLDEVEREKEPEKTKTAGSASYSPIPDPSSTSRADISTSSGLSTPQQAHHHHQHQHHHQHTQESPVAPTGPIPGAMPGPLPPPLGTMPAPWGWDPAAAAAGQPQHWGMGYGGYPNGMPPPTHALSYFNLAPAPGSSLTAELVFWQGGAKYCQQRADEIAHRLGQAAELEQQMHMLHHTEGAQAAPIPPPPAPARDEKPVRPNLNDRLAELTGVPIRSGGGTPQIKKEAPCTPPAPRPPSRPTDEELAVAKDVRAKDGRLIPIKSIAKYCKVRTDNNGVYYYNKFTRSPTWTLPDGEEANSEDEIELGPSTNSSSAEAAVSNETLSNSGGGGGGGGGSGSGGASASVSRSSLVTAITKTPIKGQPQTPPEEPADPISSHEMDEKEKLQRKSEFKTRSGELLKRYVKASMFADVEEFKKTLRKIIHGCIEKEQKMNPRFDFLFSEDVKHRMVEYTKKYVQRHKLKPLSYPEGIAD